MEIVSVKEHLSNVKLKENANYKIGTTSTHSSMQYVDGKVKSEYTKKFNITFLNAGKYEITSEWFTEIPEEFKIIKAKIEIE